MPTAAPSVRVRGLTKSYGAFEAVKGVDFEVVPGEVFGLLGPNGAGKTTTVEILEGLRPRNMPATSRCSVSIPEPREPPAQGSHRRLPAGHQPARQDHGARGDGRLLAASTRARVNGERSSSACSSGKNAMPLYAKLSGGQKQRLALALALHQRSANAVPRRADRRTRSAGRGSRSTTSSRSCAREAHHPDHHALHRGSREALRPRRHHRQRPHHRHRHAARDSGADARPIAASRSTASAPLPRSDLPQWPKRTTHARRATTAHITVTSAQPARTLVELVKWIDRARHRARRHPPQAADARRRLHRADRKEPARMKSLSRAHPRST